MIEDLSPEKIKYLEYIMRPFKPDGTDPRLKDIFRYNRGCILSLREYCSSFGGFLTEFEKLADVIEIDRITLRESGITHEQIADSLDVFVQIAESKGNNGIFNVHFNNRDYIMKALVARGGQLCPFSLIRDDGNHCGGGNVNIKLLYSENELKITNMIPHLIRSHHFFEGNVMFRVDPKKVIDFLGLESGINYGYKKHT